MRCRMAERETARDVGGVLLANVAVLAIGALSSIVLARVLGPEGKGIYTMATLLPGLIVTFGNLGIGPATAFHTARGGYALRDVVGSNVALSLLLGGFGVAVGVVVAIFFHGTAFPGISETYLLVALAVIPVEFGFGFLQYILLGAQRFREYNLASVLHVALLLVLLLSLLLGASMGITGALLATIAAWVLSDIVLVRWILRLSGPFSLRLHREYARNVVVYGLQAHAANILGFLNYRADVLIVNLFLNPTAVGQYTIAVAVGETLWLVSYAASTVLFPKVASETDEEKKKGLTPFVARTVLLFTVLGAAAVYGVSGWFVPFAYSSDYAPAIAPLRALLPGIIALAVWRPLANDIAGRGKPLLNSYIMAVSAAANVGFNVLLIPRLGITGAAWASTISYAISLGIILPVYCRLSGNSLAAFVPRPADVGVYWRALVSVARRSRDTT